MTSLGLTGLEPRDAHLCPMPPGRRPYLILEGVALVSSGGETRTLNLVINSHPLCRIELPRKTRATLPPDAPGGGALGTASSRGNRAVDCCGRAGAAWQGFWTRSGVRARGSPRKPS